MKFNFKKITAIATSVLMVGMTMGVAAAASFPSPYSSSTSAGVAIVSGTGAGVDDTVAVNSISTYLATQVRKVSGVPEGGDSLKIEKSSTKLNLGDGMDDVWGAAIVDTNLPNLLIDGTYVNDENSEYPFTQKISLSGGLDFAHFSDSDYLDRDSTIGFRLAASSPVLNYTLDWTTNPESDVSGTDLADIETTEITLLGKSYYVLDMKNSTLAMTLLDSASSTTLSEGESTTLEGHTVSINFIGSSSVKLDVDGQVTSTLAAGETQKLTDGSYIGIKEILTQDYAGGTKTVEFSIGKGKLEILNGSSIELNDVAITDVIGYVSKATASGGKEKLDKIILEWITDEEAYITPTEELLMPGFESIKFSMTEVSYPTKEVTVVEYSGDDVIELKTHIKDGAVTIPILKSSTTTGNFTYVGKDSDETLATTNNTMLFYDAASSKDDGFIASWNNSRDSETYYLEASVTRDGTTLINKTTIKNKVTGAEICKDYNEGDICTIGNVELTMTNVDYTSSTARNLNITINDGGSFQRLYTPEGMTIYLPIDVGNKTIGTAKGVMSTTNCTADDGNNREIFTLWFMEEDKDETLGGGNLFNMTLDAHSSTATTRRASVQGIYGAEISTVQETERSSKIWEYFIQDDIATNIKWDKTNTDQYSATVTYHGSEVAADVYLTSPETTVGEVGSMVFTDAEKTSWQSRDVILVGGSCINSATATALGVASGTCEATFTTATGVGSGQYLIQSVGDAFTTGKIALVVAGYEKADTAAAASRLVNQASTIDTTAGNKYLGVVGVEGTSTVSKVA